MSTTSSGNVLIINAHQYYPFSEGKLNATFVDKAISLLEDKGYQTRVVTMVEEYDVVLQRGRMYRCTVSRTRIN